MADESTLFATQFATRFLLPFRFDGSRLAGLKAFLRAAHWLPHAPNENYLADFHQNFIDRYCGTAPDNWHILQYDPDLSNRKPGPEFDIQFKKSVMAAERFNQDGRDLEIFLSPQGTGVLSIRAALRGSRKPDPGNPRHFTLAEIKTFNYSLVQDSASRNCGKIVKAAGEAYPPLALKQLCVDLLDPIRTSDFGFRLSSGARQLIPYTVVRFPQPVTFTSLHRPAGVSAEDDLAAQASILAQADEAPHPLPISEDHGAVVRVFHTDELFAASSMGAAIFIADIGVPFDNQKLQSRLDKYFLCFLVALMQRMRLLDLLDEAGAMGLSQMGPEAELKALQRLRHDMLSTVSRSDLLEISSRDAINRFYRLCQEAHGVPQALAQVQQTVMDLDASLRAEHQAANLHQVQRTQEELRLIAEKQSEHTAHMAATQNKVEWIEVFIVSFYSAELMELLGKGFHLNALYVSLWTIGAMVVGGVTAAVLVSPWEKKAAKGSGRLPPWRFNLAVLVLLLIVAVFVTVGGRYEKEADETKALREEVKELRHAIHELASVSKTPEPK